MLKVLIVDDEAIVLQTIVKTLNWSKLEMECQTSDNSLKAFEMAKKNPPDILITDICMPGMNGIELIHKIQQLNPDIETLILSGYDDFKYARSALELGVHYYLLKPFRNEELEEKLVRLRDTYLRKKNIATVMNKFSQSQYNALFSELLHFERLTDEIISSCLNKYNKTLPNTYFTIGIVRIESNQKPIENIFDLKNVLSATAESIADILGGLVLIENKINRDLVLLWYPPEHTGAIYDFFTQLKNKFEKQTGFKVTIGVSGYFRKIYMLHRAYLQALACFEQNHGHAGNIIIYTELNQNKIQTSLLSEEDCNKIMQAISCFDKNTVTMILDKYFDMWSDLHLPNISMVKNNLAEMLVLVLKLYVKNSTIMNMIFGYTPKPFIELSALNSFTEIKEYVYRIINCIFEHPEISIQKSYSPIIQQAIIYILENYNKNCNVNDFICKFNVSRSHFMRLFKKETGETFNSFLTKHRIKIAAELISTGQYKIYEICNYVGYHDVAYFSNLYKKLTGQRPSDLLAKEEEQSK
mgnify:CR=1 FL=1